MDIRYGVLRTILGVAVIVISLVGIGAGYEQVSAARDAAAFLAPGRLVDVGGHQLHVLCMGQGSPTVLFESGLANMSADWANIQPQVAASTRACAYDRAGIGWSGDGPQPRDPRRIAHELHTLLGNAGVPGPYVLVGQSFGMGLAYRALAHLGVVRLTSTFPADCGLTAQQCDHSVDFGPYARAVDPLWEQMQAELAALSSNSSHYVVQGATHSSLQLQDAHVTGTTIDHVVRSVREGQSLSPQKVQLTVTREPDFEAIDHFVDSERQAMRVPGLAIGIVHGNQMAHLAGFGQADGNGRPITPQTPFLAASLAKSFTALAVMQLVEAGKVDLDAPVQRYLSWFRVADADASARITVRHLLNQTSGFPTAPASAGLAGGDMDEQAIERGVRSLAAVSLSRPVGDTYQYSNWNYWVLGALVQAVSGQSYETYLHQRVLEPLAMRRTYTSQADARAEGLATGHRFWFGLPFAADLTYSRKFVPSGGLISTSEDLAHYLIAQLNDGQYVGTSVLSAGGISQQHRGDVRTGEGDEYYAMGWVSGLVDGRPNVHHNGTLPTGYADLRLLPEDGWGIVVLSNANSQVALPRLDGLSLGMANMLAGQQPRPVTENRLFEVLTIVACVICALQLGLMIRILARLRGWRSRPQSRPRGAQSLAWHVGVPVVLNLAWAALLVVVLPSLVGLPFGDIVFLFGDVGYLIALSAGAALVSGILGAVLAWWALRAANVDAAGQASNPARAAAQSNGR
ncbi:MAG TPA: serine hydrolase [Chloroflexota bacterium]